MTSPSKELQLSLDAVTLRSVREGRLQRSAEGIKTLGIPDDLVGLIADLDRPTLVEILEKFYLPNLLTYAFVRRGLLDGVLERDREGRVGVARRAEPLRLDGHDAWAELVNRRSDLYKGARVLCIGEVRRAERLVRAGADVTLIVKKERQVDGAQVIVGDARLIAGMHLLPFDFVISYQREGDHDKSLLSTVVGNLRPYGRYITSFDSGANERKVWPRFVMRIEKELIVTDVVAASGGYLLRAVKVPELRSDAMFFRHYMEERG